MTDTQVAQPRRRPARRAGPGRHAARGGNNLPYPVGEAGRMMGPKRREIGHGRLAKRGVLAVMPTMEAVPYTIRVVSEITEEIMKVALAQATQGRLHILGEMANALTASHGELSEFAPRLLTIKIHPDKIREVIGKGGSVIQTITKETGTRIDIQHDGTITIASVNAAAGQAANARIEQITSDVEPGGINEGKVAKIMDFGAFVPVAPGKDGLIHVLRTSSERVEKVSDKLKEGDLVKVEVLEVDKQGRIRLSIKSVEEGESAGE